MMAACGNKSGIQMGSLSEFDSLSYALGANIAYSMGYELKDIPFDYKAWTRRSKRALSTRLPSRTTLQSKSCAPIS